MKAVQKFKTLLETKRPTALSGAIGKGIGAMHGFSVDGAPDIGLHKSRSATFDQRGHAETVLTTEGVHYQTTAADINPENPATGTNNKERNTNSTPKFISPGLHHEESGDKGHAHDPLDEQPLFLGIGAGGDFLEAPPQDLVAESPTAAEFNIYDKAYQEEVERIRAAQGHTATVYLTRRVDSKKEYKADENMVQEPKASDTLGGATAGFKDLLDKAREKKIEPENKERLAGGGNRFSEIAAKAMENTRTFGRGLSDRGGGMVDNMLAKAVEKRNEQKEQREAKEKGLKDQGER